jgi:S-adenosylmethionine synthetase
MNYLFTSESVGEGHPDKLCDQVSDALLDAYLEKDSESRVAIETLVKTGFIVVAGEVTSKANIEIQDIVRKAVKDAGYDNPSSGFDGNTCGVLVSILKQSPDISMGVDSNSEKEQGAGDQGLMFGYATNETQEYIPLSIMLSHKLLKKISELRRSGEISYLMPDGKSQVTVEYENGNPKRVHTIVVSNQHSADVSQEQIKGDIIEKVIKPVCGNWIDEKTVYHVNPTGKFVIGGPVGDTGVTGRKIIVDSYGGMARHGGGCFSGKDPSKVDRSAAYAARYAAKNIVAAGLADKCEIQIAYAIGVAEPVSVYVDCFGTNKISEEKISELVRKYFPLKPGDIIKQLDLKKPIYHKTATYGHFGRIVENNSIYFSWEKLDKVDILKREI